MQRPWGRRGAWSPQRPEDAHPRQPASLPAECLRFRIRAQWVSNGLWRFGRTAMTGKPNGTAIVGRRRGGDLVRVGLQGGQECRRCAVTPVTQPPQQAQDAGR
ncbi:hypothetical protein KNE206_68300 [Kitasatospora sp. NE20-6]